MILGENIETCGGIYYSRGTVPKRSKNSAEI